MEPCQGFEIRLSDRSLGVFYNDGIEIIFHSSNVDFPVIRHEFQVLMVQQIDSGTARFTVTDVYYRFKTYCMHKLYCDTQQNAATVMIR